MRKEGEHAYFRSGERLARLPLPQAYSVYLSGPEGNQATTSVVDTWVLVAVHGQALQQPSSVVEMYITVLPPDSTLKAMPTWFEQAPTDPVLASCGEWNGVATGGGFPAPAMTPKKMDRVALVQDAKVDQEINTRVLQLQQDSGEADRVNGMHTSDGYVRCRVKRALLLVNREGLRDTLERAQTARDRMMVVLRRHHELAPLQFTLPTSCANLDAYTPDPTDYNL
jgi:hypothetical protein